MLRRLQRPRSFLERAQPGEIFELFDGFKHRFTTGGEVSSLLVGIKRAVETSGSLEGLFAAGLGCSDESVLPALAEFVDRLRGFAGGPGACASLLSSPADGSACKRLNLYLRWMTRRDAVDPGPWTAVSPALLIVPLDTHLFRISGGLGLTRRKQADLKTAVEVTHGFAALSPRDPVRYDFALTRLGINPACRALEAGIANPWGLDAESGPTGPSPCGPGNLPAPARGQRQSSGSLSQQESQP